MNLELDSQYPFCIHCDFYHRKISGSIKKSPYLIKQLQLLNSAITIDFFSINGLILAFSFTAKLDDLRRFKRSQWF